MAGYYAVVRKGQDDYLEHIFGFGKKKGSQKKNHTATSPEYLKLYSKFTNAILDYDKYSLDLATKLYDKVGPDAMRKWYSTDRVDAYNNVRRSEKPLSVREYDIQMLESLLRTEANG